MFEFKFPEERNNYQITLGKQELLQTLQHDDDYQYFQMRYRISVRKQKYLYCRCAVCFATLTYRKSIQEPHFTLIKFCNIHNHQTKNFRNNSMLINFIKQIPDTIDLKYAKMLTMSSFPRTTEGQFYYYFQKIKHFNGSFCDLVKKLNSESFQIVMTPHDKAFSTLPNLFLVISPAMKTQYKKYGSFTSFDLTFHTIKQRKDGKIFKVGAFLGLSSTRRIIPFGLAILLDQTKERFYQLFKNFGLIMEKNPSYLITDESAGMIAALKELNQEDGFECHHILDIFHLQRNIKKKLIVKDHLKYFTSLIKAKNEFIFQEKLQQAYEYLQIEEIDILTKFIQQKTNQCFAHIPIVKNDIFGFSTSSSINEKFHDLLKSRITHQQPYVKVVSTALKLLNELIQKGEKVEIQKFPIQKYYFCEIKEIRYSIDKRVFQQFCFELQKIHLLEISLRQIDYLQLFDINLSQIFKLVLEDEYWKCSCKYLQRSGSPCSHLIKACLISKQRILKYINQRWLANKTGIYNQQNKRISTGKLSRRNK